MTSQTGRRGRWLTGLVSTLAVTAATLWQGAGGLAAEAPLVEAEAGRMISPAAEKAIENGLRYLARAQHEDGSFASGGYRGNVAISGLAGLAFLASGSTPNRGPYGENVDRAVRYIMDRTQESGFITAPGSASHGPMYGHGFAALCLAECYGMSAEEELRDKLRGLST